MCIQNSQKKIFFPYISQPQIIDMDNYKLKRFGNENTRRYGINKNEQFCNTRSRVNANKKL